MKIELLEKLKEQVHKMDGRHINTIELLGYRIYIHPDMRKSLIELLIKNEKLK